MAKILLSQIVPNPEQPRGEFDQSELEDLAQSMHENGLIQPVVVETLDGELFTLIDGERRYRAAKILNWREIEAVVRPSRNGSGQRDRLLHALVANVQRSDLGPVDEARAYAKLRNMGNAPDEIAVLVGRHPSHINSRLRMLEFPPEVQDLYNAGKLPIDEYLFGALRKLPEDQLLMVTRVAAARGLTSAKIRAMCTRITRVKDGGVRIRAKKAQIEGSTAPAWDLNQVLHGNYSRLERHVRATCHQCGLYEGSHTVCKECPLTMMLGMLGGEE
jgi:ParB family transcriptional regulator, chromosome partitioning protein